MPDYNSGTGIDAAAKKYSEEMRKKKEKEEASLAEYNPKYSTSFEPKFGYAGKPVSKATGPSELAKMIRGGGSPLDPEKLKESEKRGYSKLKEMVERNRAEQEILEKKKLSKR